MIWYRTGRAETVGSRAGSALGRRALLLSAAWLLAAQSPAPPAPAPPAPAPPAPGTADIHHLAPGEASGVLGAKVVSAEGEEIGRIIDVIVDPAGHPRAAVIDFGGFMGIGNRKIAVAWKSLHFPAGTPDGAVICDLTPDQMKATPEYQDNSGKPAAVATPSGAPKPTPAAPAASPPATNAPAAKPAPS